MPAINQLLLSALVPYVARGIKNQGARVSRVDTGVLRSSAPPAISPSLLSYGKPTPPPVTLVTSNTPVGLQYTSVTAAPV